ncbi:hypothetical protein AXK11_04230 [Cephaloticoccus primus]|uniref:Uncharacterized protein n=1 Tax=Cephaloticoccus primus TaxID=1548207 RepID=A0A139SPX9_9BACT|nr:hypothetical protein AXK11_04230 [Cephaloticoccus primus]
MLRSTQNEGIVLLLFHVAGMTGQMRNTGMACILSAFLEPIIAHGSGKIFYLMLVGDVVY